jgi:hypothetical protein
LVGVESGDDGDQVGFDGAVHLGEACLAVGLGAGDQRAGAVKLLAVWAYRFATAATP